MNYEILTIKNETTDTIIGNGIKLANTFIKRLVGLIFHSSLKPNEGMLLTPCYSIHMLFMRFPIDAVFIDKSHKVIAIYNNLKPWFGITKIHSDSYYVLELPNNSVNNKIKLGDIIQIK